MSADQQLKVALIRFHDAITAADGAGLSSALNDVESLARTHRASLHPQLVHFLDGRSYAKALAWLGASDVLAARPASPPGGCGGGHA